MGRNQRHQSNTFSRRTMQNPGDSGIPESPGWSYEINPIRLVKSKTVGNSTLPLTRGTTNVLIAMMLLPFCELGSL